MKQQQAYSTVHVVLTYGAVSLHCSCPLHVCMYLQAMGIKRDATESDLEFVGFVVISSPVKVDSKHNIECILQASHHVSN